MQIVAFLSAQLNRNNLSNIRGDSWANLVEILVFPTPTASKLTSFWFLDETEEYSVDSCKWVDTFPEVLNLDELFLSTNSTSFHL
jgi:hypothetical protein